MSSTPCADLDTLVRDYTLAILRMCFATKERLPLTPSAHLAKGLLDAVAVLSDPVVMASVQRITSPDVIPTLTEKTIMEINDVLSETECHDKLWGGIARMMTVHPWLVNLMRKLTLTDARDFSQIRQMLESALSLV